MKGKIPSIFNIHVLCQQETISAGSSVSLCSKEESKGGGVRVVDSYVVYSVDT